MHRGRYRRSFAWSMVNTIFYAFAIFTTPLNAQQRNQGGIFQLEQLPLGADVTLPGPATTHVAMASRVTLTSTDAPQTVSFTTVASANGVAAPIRLAIFDKNSDRVRYVELKPGKPFLYSFKNLATIAVVPQAAGASGKNTAKLQLESDKALMIAR